FVHRGMRDNGASAIEVVRAALIALEVLETRAFFERVEALGATVDAEAQYEAIAHLVSAVESVVSWMLFNNVGLGDFEHAVGKYRAPLQALRAELRTYLTEGQRERFDARVAGLVEQGFGADLAADIAGLAHMASAFGIIEVAGSTGEGVADAARRFFELGQRLTLGWLREELQAVPTTGPWEK